jgi:hypothetical protein
MFAGAHRTVEHEMLRMDETDEMRRMVTEAVAETQTFAKSTEKAAARANDLIAADQELLLRARKVLARSRSHLKTPTAHVPPTINWEQELAHLKRADAHITDARKRIQLQRQLIRQLGKLRSPTDTAEVILQTMLDTLRALEGQRSVILDRLTPRDGTWTKS